MDYGSAMYNSENETIFTDLPSLSVSSGLAKQLYSVE